MAIIDKPTDYFNTVLWSGDNVDGRAITTGLETNWTWAKRRNATNGFIIADSVRGATYKLDSSTTNAEVNNYDGGHLESFTSTGFTMGVGSGDFGHLNASGGTYVAWNWKAGTSFTNDASATGIGSIDSTGSVNTTSGFSICSYTGTGSAGTIKHGLSTAPKMIIWKNRSATASWQVYHHTLPLSSGEYQALQLNLTNVSAPFGTYNFMNATAPTSTVFSLDGVPEMNGNGNSIIAYCFAEKQGYSKFGSYVGSNSGAYGPFIYTGFKPAFVLIKDSSAANAWTIRDDKRNTYNPATNFLVPDSNAAEVTLGEAVDILSNGFKIKANGGKVQDSGNTYIYMAFAENPFVSSTGVPATAR